MPLNNSVLIDINECSDGVHICQQVCNNTAGSHHCLCFDGYELNSDGYSCDGENGVARYNQNFTPIIIYAFPCLMAQVSMTSYAFIIILLQMWMNVPLTSMNVIKTVTILLDHTHVSVIQATRSVATISSAKVGMKLNSTSLCTNYSQCH